jgi:hypothetical protein
MDSIDDLAAVDPLQVHRGDPEVRVAELALDHIQRYALSRHLDGVRVTKLVWGEATTHRRLAGEVSKLRPCCRGRSRSPSGGPVDYAEKRADW